MRARVLKILKSTDGQRGLVFGHAIVCKIGGEPYVDTQDHHIPEDVMLDAAAEFAAGDRAMKVMHDGEVVGEVLFMWPHTTDVAEAFGLSADVTGLMVGVKPSSPEVLEKFHSGELSGFSIAGDGWI